VATHSVYLNKEQEAFFASRPKDWLKRLVLAEMEADAREVPRPAAAQPHCRKCGGLISGGRCVFCGRAG
jgi:hypothetical protein